MMQYEYEHESGARIERSFPIGAAPQRVRVGRRVFRRALSVPSLIVAGGTRHGRAIDYVSDHLSADLHGKYHRGQIVSTPHGPKLHFSNTAEEEHLRRAWNDGPESEQHGKLRKVGECDEWRERTKLHHEEHGTGA